MFSGNDPNIKLMILQSSLITDYLKTLLDLPFPSHMTITLTYIRPMLYSYRDQSIDSQCKSSGWLLS